MNTERWKIGIVGLGNMGSAIGEALLHSGYSLTVFDINPQAIARMKSVGALAASNIGELTEQSNIIFTSLPNAKAVRDVYLNENGILSRIHSETILVELSTIDPDTIRELERLSQEKNAILLDIPVSGSPKEAREGKLTLIAGGCRKTIDEILPILKCFSSTLHYVGSPGNAKIIKIVNNMMTMGNVLVAAEAFSVGVKAGIDPQILFDVLSQSGGRSHHFCKRFPNALQRNFNPGFTVELGEKDLGLAMELAENVKIPVPVIGFIRQIYKIAMSEGLSKQDIVAVLKLYEKWGSDSNE